MMDERLLTDRMAAWWTDDGLRSTQWLAGTPILDPLMPVLADADPLGLRHGCAAQRPPRASVARDHAPPERQAYYVPCWRAPRAGDGESIDA